jgi:hypothetical protein
MPRLPTAIAATTILALGACSAGTPAQPSVTAMPSIGKSIEVFGQEDAACRDYAAKETGPASPAQAGIQTEMVRSAAGGLVGAGAGALLGSLKGAMGTGAALGGPVGIVAGALTAGSAASAASGKLQQRYDIAYAQCMHAKGNMVAGVQAMAGRRF